MSHIACRIWLATVLGVMGGLTRAVVERQDHRQFVSADGSDYFLQGATDASLHHLLQLPVPLGRDCEPDGCCAKAYSFEIKSKMSRFISS